MYDPCPHTDRRTRDTLRPLCPYTLPEPTPRLPLVESRRPDTGTYTTRTSTSQDLSGTHQSTNTETLSSDLRPMSPRLRRSDLLRLGVVVRPGVRLEDMETEEGSVPRPTQKKEPGEKESGRPTKFYTPTLYSRFLPTRTLNSIERRGVGHRKSPTPRLMNPSPGEGGRRIFSTSSNTLLT